MRIVTLFTYLLGATHVSTREFKEREICHDGDCYPVLFEPTHEFRVIREGQEIPAGLHIKINLETGLKEGKWMDENEHASADEGALIPIPNPNSGDVSRLGGMAGGQETGDKDRGKSSSRPIPYKPNPKIQDGEHELFLTSISNLHSTSASSSSPSGVACSDKILGALDTLEDLVHELDFGARLIDRIKSDALDTILQLIGSSDVRCRSKAALVLGSALQNNPHAIAAIPESTELTGVLVKQLAKETDETSKRMLMYALSAAFGSRTAYHDFHKVNGDDIVANLYEHGSAEIKGKIAALVEDHFATPDEKRDNSLRIQGNAGVYGKTLLDNVSLGNWCVSFQASLLDAEIESMGVREKLLSAARYRLPSPSSRTLMTSV